MTFDFVVTKILEYESEIDTHNVKILVIEEYLWELKFTVWLLIYLLF